MRIMTSNQSNVSSNCCGGASRWVTVLAVAACVLGGGYYAWRAVSVASAAAPQTAKSAESSRVERGKYLVTIVGCNDCHTPFKMTEKGPAPDMDRMLSGHPEQMKLPPVPKAQGPWVWGGAATNTAFYGPWGVSYSANLTPDKNTGLGIWTEEMFVSAIRTGKHWGQPGARPIQPPMPWPFYSKMSDEDLKSIWAYLRTIPPIRNAVPDYVTPE
jgi:hypothetical protein